MIFQKLVCDMIRWELHEPHWADVTCYLFTYHARLAVLAISLPIFVLLCRHRIYATFSISPYRAIFPNYVYKEHENHLNLENNILKHSRKWFQSTLLWEHLNLSFIFYSVCYPHFPQNYSLYYGFCRCMGKDSKSILEGHDCSYCIRCKLDLLSFPIQRQPSGILPGYFTIWEMQISSLLS